MSLLNPILAKAATIPEEITVGGIITAIMFMMTAAGSLTMIVVWVVRYSQTGNALPAARRGVLRVPWPLTFAGVALSVLFMLLMLLGSVAEISSVANNPVAVSTTAGAETNAADSDADREEAHSATTETPEPEVIPSDATSSETTADRAEATEKITEADSDTDGKDAADSATSPGISPEKMQDALVQTIVMDLIMLLTFGVVVLVASQGGRVYLKKSLAGNRQRSGRSSSMLHQTDGATDTGTGMRVDTRWPDLDDGSVIPQIQRYGFPGKPALPEREQTPPERAAEFTAPQQSPAPYTPQPELHIGEHNPFAVTRDVARFGSDSTATALSADNPGSADEPFSFVRELRFAAEVFLAAYLPTAALKLIIVLISVSIVGEPPRSHPFLEMLEAGVSVSMIAAILIMAVFVAPIVEELQFRVVVLGGIAQLGRPGLALFGSSILFAFAHGFPDSIALLPLAIGLGYTYLRRRSYVTVMCVHFLFNAFNMVLALVALL